MTTDYCLYHMPGSCSRVVINALEEIELPYREHGVALLRGAQHEPWFRAINPKGKVPVLVADATIMTETPAILHYLAGAHPEAALLPVDGAGEPTLASLSDLIWLSGALHPVVNRIFRPGAVSAIDAEGIKTAAITQLYQYATLIAARVDGEGWWYGTSWSIVDTFIVWLFALATDCGFALDRHPPLVSLRRRIEARPAFLRATRRERGAVERDALPLPPGAVL